jgi:hypothetical protein
MNIPARYCTGYLGDIGVPASDVPMDFAAWFEAYVGGTWYTFDARNNIPRIGRVLWSRRGGCRDQHDYWTEYAPQLYGTDRRSRGGGMTPGRFRAIAAARPRLGSGSIADDNRRRRVIAELADNVW